MNNIVLKSMAELDQEKDDPNSFSMTVMRRKTVKEQ